MADTVGNLFGIHAAALGIREARLDVLASNLANADTPNYKARDVDFNQALADATTASAMNASATKQESAAGAKTSTEISTAPDLSAALRYRVPTQPSLDGNTVDSDYEHAAFARAALEYKATLSFVSARAKTLMTAITGS